METVTLLSGIVPSNNHFSIRRIEARGDGMTGISGMTGGRNLDSKVEISCFIM